MVLTREMMAEEMRRKRSMLGWFNLLDYEFEVEAEIGKGLIGINQ